MARYRHITWFVLAAMANGGIGIAGTDQMVAAIPAGLANAHFRCGADTGRGVLVSLKAADDSQTPIEFVWPGHAVGDVIVRFRSDSGPWRELATSGTHNIPVVEKGTGSFSFTHFGTAHAFSDIELRVSFALTNDELGWTIGIRNTSTQSVEIGDIALPLMMNTEYVWDHDETFMRRVFRHAFIAGHAASGYGYWSPGALHDGAASWGFQPRQVGTEWNPATVDLPRGAWPVDGENDHGLVAGIEAATTLVFDDPLFGLIAYGGVLATNGTMISVVPRDGVRQRLDIVLDGRRIHVALDRDGLAREQPVVFGRACTAFQFTLENRTSTAHKTMVRIGGQPQGRCRVKSPATDRTVESDGKTPVDVQVTMGGAATESFNIEFMTNNK